MEIRPFADADVDAAAELLARRHERHLAAEPLLPRDVDFRAQIEREWSREGASGAIAAGGYLSGAPTSNTNTGERRILVDLAGHAADPPELARDLYAAAAERWVADGLTSHAVVVPSHDRALVDAWFRLAFGLQFVYAVRETEARPSPPDRGRSRTRGEHRPRPRRHRAGRSRLRRGPGAHGTRPRLGARARLLLDHHRLAQRQSPGLAFLAAARMPREHYRLYRSVP